MTRPLLPRQLPQDSTIDRRLENLERRSLTQASDLQAGLGDEGLVDEELVGFTRLDGTALGIDALTNLVPASGVAASTAVGVRALQSTPFATIASVALGYEALREDIDGGANVGVGAYALLLNESGDYLVAVGFQALYNNLGSYNTAAGGDALVQNTSGEHNVAVGFWSGYAHGPIPGQPVGAVGATSTGSRQTLLGAESSGRDTGQHDDVVAVGYRAVFAASDVVALGVRTRAYHDNSVALGADSATTDTFQVMVGPRDVEITDSAKGYVLRSPDGTRWRIQVDNAGVVFAS